MTLPKIIKEYLQEKKYVVMTVDYGDRQEMSILDGYFQLKGSKEVCHIPYDPSTKSVQFIYPPEIENGNRLESILTNYIESQARKIGLPHHPRKFSTAFHPLVAASGRF